MESGQEGVEPIPNSVTGKENLLNPPLYNPHSSRISVLHTALKSSICPR